jgi:hypothetical protein
MLKGPVMFFISHVLSTEFLLLLLAGNEGPPHLSSTYTTAEKVPHPMVNPTEVS